LKFIPVALSCPSGFTQTKVLPFSFVAPEETKVSAEFYLLTMTSGIATRSPENSAFFPWAVNTLKTYSH